ncbi:MAG: DUF554 domain-containing protein [Candidatus Izemoplasma sp.]|nr:DUF554 domain-containing protein [Candidatus Izemoplasma sp.]
MSGVLVNVFAIIFGGSIGLILNRGLNERVKKVIMQGVGLSVIIIGIAGALTIKSPILMVVSLVVGGLIGSLIQIESRLDRLGKRIERTFKNDNNGFAKGFVWATLIYCVGAMAIVGSLEAGLNGDNTTLYIKAILDGVTAIIFAATLGFGVIFSSISVFIYQGAIVLLGYQIEPYLTEHLINEVSAIGSVLIMAIGINILEIKHIHVGDLLPAIIIPAIYFLALNVYAFVIGVL